MSLFFEKIKSNKVKTPTQLGFSLKSWNDCWASLEGNADTSDRELFDAGIIIFDLLDEIRKELTKLYKEHAPNITNSELLAAYISISNRDRALMSQQPLSSKFSMHSSTLTNNAGAYELTLQEISDSAVDGLEKAIYFCKSRLKNSQEIIKGNSPLCVMNFIFKEIRLSQLYGIYENYWHAILWNNFELIELDKNKKEYLVKQPKDKFEIGSYVSQIRKTRLDAQNAIIAESPEILSHYDKDKYITVVKRGRKRDLLCLSIKNANPELKATNSNWKSSYYSLIDNFGVDVLNNQNIQGFSINEALEVFRNLILLSITYTNKYPSNFDISDIKKIFQFCPKVKKLEICLAIAKSSDYKVEKVRKILSFIEYSASDKEDLWCHPIVSVSESEYALLTSSLITPVILRVVEHWLVNLNIDYQDKGFVYEKLIIDGVNEAIGNNPMIIDSNKAFSGLIKVDNGEEEIDLILRIGNVVLIGEAKSIVTTDSPISNYRTVETLKHAAAQVKRKSHFVQNNLLGIFEKLNWKYENDTQYEFVSCILNSGRMYVGFDIDEVPVCDEKILLKYFQDNLVPIVSVFDEFTKDAKHLAWLILYSNFDELKNNLKVYLNRPPQIFENEEHFEYKCIPLPQINENSYKVIFKRFIPKDLSVKDRVEIKHDFPIGKIQDYDNEINKMNFIV